MASESSVIQAAGAVLWRYSKTNKIEIALVHRPRYDDWSLPKGKVEEKESHIACAYREVSEETGFKAIFGPEIGKATYKSPEGKKVVRYWSAQAVGEAEGGVDKNEIDEILWLEVKDARKKLTLDDDREIVDFFIDFVKCINFRCNFLPVTPLSKWCCTPIWDADYKNISLPIVSKLD